MMMSQRGRKLTRRRTRSLVNQHPVGCALAFLSLFLFDGCRKSTFALKGGMGGGLRLRFEIDWGVCR